jgi:hypothetical protein
MAAGVAIALVALLVVERRGDAEALADAGPGEQAPD